MLAGLHWRWCGAWNFPSNANMCGELTWHFGFRISSPHLGRPFALSEMFYFSPHTLSSWCLQQHSSEPNSRFPTHIYGIRQPQRSHCRAHDIPRQCLGLCRQTDPPWSTAPYFTDQGEWHIPSNSKFFSRSRAGEKCESHCVRNGQLTDHCTPYPPTRKYTIRRQQGHSHSQDFIHIHPSIQTYSPPSSIPTHPWLCHDI